MVLIMACLSYWSDNGLIETSFSQSSVLATGKWYKLEVDKHGVYRIDHSLVKKMGFNPSSIDPRNIRIYSQGAGMLPQLNSEPRISDLQELAIQVIGEEDGVFNSQDYILFYGEGPDRFFYDLSRDVFQYEKNLYEKSNKYFFTIGDSPGKRLQSGSSMNKALPVIREFENFVYHELDRYNVLKSGREWFGEQFDITTELTLRFELPQVIENSPVKLISDVMGQAFSNTSFNVFINGVQAGQHEISPIPNTQYGIKGRHDRDTFLINSNTVLAPGKNLQEVRYQFVKNPNFRSTGYLDFMLLQLRQQLQLYGKQTLFRSVASLQQAESTFEITQSQAGAQIWDVTDPFNPIFQLPEFNGGKTSFSSTTTSLKEFIVFLPDAPAPRTIGPVVNQNIRGSGTPSLIIVTYPEFKEEALRLKSHRESLNGISVLVATTEEVFNEFSGGKQDVTAIRDMARYFYEKSSGTLRSLLLFGKCSYDYKDILIDNQNRVPTYQSRNSLSPLQTYSSDDYFGFFESHEGNWNEFPAEPHTMEIAVGRLPVKTKQEAQQVVDKIIRYDTDPEAAGRWRKSIVFIADDGDNGTHHLQADLMARNIDTNFPFYDTRKIYLDAFNQVPGASGEVSPETRNAIQKAFNDGALVINYTGHGAERLWAQERILDDALILNLKNKKLPLLITATCEFGRQDDPMFPSGAEFCMLQPDGGAIGLITTARPVDAYINFDLNQAFYTAFFQKENGQNLSLGEIFRRTKNTSISGVSNRNFSLIGDPSQYLAMPEQIIKINSIATADNSTVLKALSTVSVSGEIVDETDSRISDFEGVVEATLFDKETSFLTKGNENPPFAYEEWYNAIFRGKASVEQGVFNLQFIVPKNIAYSVEPGKLSAYAHSSVTGDDASGYSTSFDVGSSETNPAPDLTPPVIQLYLGDETFVSGGIVQSTTRLLARLYDESGINISGYGIGNSLVAILDEEQMFVLNEYYISDLDDYKNGTVDFLLADLKPGNHSLTLQAWDTHNNPAQATIDFRVTDQDALVIEDFKNYPNPFQNSTQFYFRHNQSGADLEAQLVLYDPTGRTLQTVEYWIPASTYEVELPKLNAEDAVFKNVGPGLYVARLIVRSVSDGSRCERVTKLIITN